MDRTGNKMKHKGYVARVEFDAEDRLFFGRLAGIRVDIISDLTYFVLHEFI